MYKINKRNPMALKALESTRKKIGDGRNPTSLHASHSQELLNKYT